MSNTTPSQLAEALVVLAEMAAANRLDRLQDDVDPAIRLSFQDDQDDQVRARRLTAAMTDTSVETWTGVSGWQYRTTKGQLLTMHIETTELLPDATEGGTTNE